MEVPDETALCIYISGCLNKCKECHYPELQSPDSGELLSVYFESMLDLYHEYITCVCFLGEGDLSSGSRGELIEYLEQSHFKGYKCCLYSGRDIEIEKWMRCFEYIKLGSYKSELGSLSSISTNQRMFKRQDSGEFIDITYRFLVE
ncbi:MAG: 4Fe-4S cluster-binding domain-containing protein [Anaerocolumna sp.]